MVSKSFTLFIPFATRRRYARSGVLSLDIVEGPPRGVWFGTCTPEAASLLPILFKPRLQLGIERF
jgi:hypothetical protein